VAETRATSLRSGARSTTSRTISGFVHASSTRPTSSDPRKRAPNSCSIHDATSDPHSVGRSSTTTTSDPSANAAQPIVLLNASPRQPRRFGGVVDAGSFGVPGVRVGVEGSNGIRACKDAERRVEKRSRAAPRRLDIVAVLDLSSSCSAVGQLSA
jgi:hypothetical protein